MNVQRKHWGDQIEETLIAVLLGSMTVITFANVVARFLNQNILWALEATVFLFAWLVLLGASYGVKHNFHIGVDIVANLLPVKGKKVLALFAVSACLLFSVLLLIGGWNYWYPFTSTRAFFETNDIPMPAALQFMADWFNEGEQYEKIPRMIPYAVLPLSTALLTFRYLQACFRILNDRQTQLIVSHELDEKLNEAGDH